MPPDRGDVVASFAVRTSPSHPPLAASGAANGATLVSAGFANGAIDCGAMPCSHHGVADGLAGSEVSVRLEFHGAKVGASPSNSASDGMV
jgi:hypothetical protein